MIKYIQKCFYSNGLELFKILFNFLLAYFIELLNRIHGLCNKRDIFSQNNFDRLNHMNEVC